MACLIAVATSDGSKIDLHFGQAENYLIYEADGKEWRFVQKRDYVPSASEGGVKDEGCCAQAGARVELLKDCRAVVAARIGFKVQKEFSKLGISVFDELDCSVEEALKNITEYFYKADNHIAQNKI